ncbi:MAG: hypothetical protein COV59_05370 [Candidatus Magasanikbacteria bacterium CG11_big_fil_rev_8_21_14_0_20_39_34]|uniref:Inosine monophosphate cyclohydrolase-like domain-containing protein n=1 Tax=Candidatus Magasanikbacteria bacterium CG11_big_fil_rev_8_21_14_0_20_39_34 TaxID=1974653 RepID=A0A2H0N3X3_9BACT|nr:MAG: hypothetical protein COV59_05370 [Candidatus Magasanikbacteria bacterium CG11_big_fil_rev_8_21_14_0_20_39_34]
MNEKLGNVSKKMEYPGRFIMLGKMGGKYWTVYGVTARSESSKAKRYIWDEKKNQVCVEPTDKAIMSEGDLSLLDYIAVKVFENGLIVGNGQQVNRQEKIEGESALSYLEQALSLETYEPDKYCTPRITGCFLKSEGIWTAALHSITSDPNGETLHNGYPIPLEENIFYFLSTYAGPNVRPTPSFCEKPLHIDIKDGTLQEIVFDIFNTWSPKENQEDLRVSVVGFSFCENTENRDYFIKNMF